MASGSVWTRCTAWHTARVVSSVTRNTNAWPPRYALPIAIVETRRRACNTSLLGRRPAMRNQVCCRVEPTMTASCKRMQSTNLCVRRLAEEKVVFQFLTASLIALRGSSAPLGICVSLPFPATTTGTVRTMSFVSNMCRVVRKLATPHSTLRKYNLGF